MPDFEDDEPVSEANFDRLLRESSLGSSAARRLRRRVSDDQLQRVRRLLSAGAGEISISISTDPVDHPIAIPAAPDAGRPALEADPERGEHHEDESDGSASGQSGDRQVAGGAPDLSDRELEVLSERALEVLRLLAAGRTVADISAELMIASGSVMAHIHRLQRLARMGYFDRDAAAILFAMH